MHELIAWCGFLGAWALVVGPVHQAYLELSEEEFEREKFEGIRGTLAPPEPISAWWWLFPPAHLLLSRHRTEDYKDQMLLALDDEDFANLMSYMNKASAWMVVGAGGVLIATKETFELLEHLEWPEWLLFVIVPAMFLFSVAYTVGQARRDKRAFAARQAGGRTTHPGPRS